MIALAPPVHSGNRAPHSGRFDVAGAVLATLGMTAIVFGTVNSAEAGWTSPITVATLAAGGDTTDLALPQRSESGAADHATEVVP